MNSLLNTLKRIIRPLFAFSSMQVSSQRVFNLLEDANLHLPLLNAIKAGESLTARMALQAALNQWHEQAKAYAVE